MRILKDINKIGPVPNNTKMGIKCTKKNDPVIFFKKIATEIIFKYYQKISIQKTALNTQVGGNHKN